MADVALVETQMASQSSTTASKDSPWKEYIDEIRQSNSSYSSRLLRFLSKKPNEKYDKNVQAFVVDFQDNTSKLYTIWPSENSVSDEDLLQREYQPA
jgi:hypothetical protein